jgi:hypothetical protein
MVKEAEQQNFAAVLLDVILSEVTEGNAVEGPARMKFVRPLPCESKAL